MMINFLKIYTQVFTLEFSHIQNTRRDYGFKLPQALFSHGPSMSCLIYLLENTCIIPSSMREFNFLRFDMCSVKEIQWSPMLETFANRACGGSRIFHWQLVFPPAISGISIDQVSKNRKEQLFYI